jgi:hypothetical protein
MLLFPKMWDSGAKAFPKSPKFSAYFWSIGLSGISQGFLLVSKSV